MADKDKEEGEEKSDAEVAAAAGVKKPFPLVPILTGLNTVLITVVLVKSFLAPPVVVPPPPADGETVAAAAPKEGKGKAEGGGKEGHEGGAKEGGPKHGGLGPTLKLPDFVVHLRDPETERFARITFELEVAAEPEKEKVTSSMPKIRELFISYLSDRTTDELAGSEGMDRVKKDLLAKLETQLPTAPVRSLYITDIVIQ